MSDTLFDKIVSGEISSYKIWEDNKHLAFLTPFPNSPGITVLIPKKNLSDYIFDLDDKDYVDLMIAAKKLSKIIEKALKTKRVALIIEGTGVAYVHVKLIPLFGELADRTGVWSKDRVFDEEYQGYLTTKEGPEMSPDRLASIQDLIKKYSKK